MAKENVLKNDEIKIEEKEQNPKTLEEFFLREFQLLRNQNEELAKKVNEFQTMLTKFKELKPQIVINVEPDETLTYTLSFANFEDTVDSLYVEGDKTSTVLSLTNFFGLTEDLVKDIEAKKASKNEVSK